MSFDVIVISNGASSRTQYAARLWEQFKSVIVITSKDNILNVINERSVLLVGFDKPQLMDQITHLAKEVVIYEEGDFLERTIRELRITDPRILSMRDYLQNTEPDITDYLIDSALYIIDNKFLVLGLTLLVVGIGYVFLL